MPKILAVKTVFPSNVYTQKELSDFVSEIWQNKAPLVKKFFTNVMVNKRHLALPLSRYLELKTFEATNMAWQQEALNLLTMAVTSLINEEKIPLNDIKAIISTSVTGITVPSLEARLMNRLPFDTNLTRIPLFGLGCLGGVAGLNRANDFLKANPEKMALLTAVELCSLTFQWHDQSLGNLVATSLFGDGAAAVLMVGDNHPLARKCSFEVVDSASFFFPQTEDVMGWKISERGFEVVLSGDVPLMVSEKVPANIKSFLGKHALTLSDIEFVVSHPGGPKVIEAMAVALEKEKQDLRHSYDSLREQGNMSSVSVLDILSRTMKDKRDKNQLGLMIAMGPAFCAEVSLLRAV